MRLLVDRRDELARARTQALNRAHRLLAEVMAGGAPTKKSIAQYQALLAGVRPWCARAAADERAPLALGSRCMIRVSSNAGALGDLRRRRMREHCTDRFGVTWVPDVLAAYNA